MTIKQMIKASGGLGVGGAEGSASAPTPDRPHRAVDKACLAESKNVQGGGLCRIVGFIPLPSQGLLERGRIYPYQAWR